MNNISAPLISVIIATHNRIELLQNCLKYVYNQAYPSFEVVVVDNGSTDGTSDWITHSQHPIHLIQRTHNHGAWSARSMAIDAAQGEYFLLLDDDSELHDPNSLQKAVDMFTAGKHIGIIAFHILDGDSGHVDKRLVPRKDRSIIMHNIEVAHFVAAGAIMHKEAYEQAGGFWERLDPYFGGDMELGYRILDNGYSIIQTPDITVKHFINKIRLLHRTHARIRYGTAHAPWMAIRNLPWHCVISMTSVAWGFFFLDSLRCGRPDLFFTGCIESILGIPKAFKARKCIQRSTRRKIHMLKGRYYC